MDVAALAEGVRRGEILTLGKALSFVEKGGRDAAALLEALEVGEEGPPRIGIAGPPGAGKSTLASGLVRAFRARGERVALLAVDPSSPFSGGALLGDRIRLSGQFEDEGVFIRSVATRGAAGGLSPAVADMAEVCAAAGFDRILIETVGIGQAELEVMRVADLVLLVLQPGAGDGVQAMKAGILEIADLIACNKADLPGIEALESQMREMLDLRAREVGRRPLLLRTTARSAEGIEDLAAAIEARWREIGEEERKRRREERWVFLVRSRVLDLVREALDAEDLQAEPGTVPALRARSFLRSLAARWDGSLESGEGS